jgi:hypothetical protein
MADTAAEKEEKESVVKAGETHGKSPSPGLGNGRFRGLSRWQWRWYSSLMSHSHWEEDDAAEEYRLGRHGWEGALLGTLEGHL